MRFTCPVYKSIEQLFHEFLGWCHPFWKAQHKSMESVDTSMDWKKKKKSSVVNSLVYLYLEKKFTEKKIKIEIYVNIVYYFTILCVVNRKYRSIMIYHDLLFTKHISQRQEASIRNTPLSGITPIYNKIQQCRYTFIILQ